MLVGDDVVHPHEEPIPREITGVGETFERATIFRDLFGKSAFANLEQRGQSSKVEVLRSLPDVYAGAKAMDLTVLDGPSHLLPPVGSLFDSLIESFTRPTPPPAQPESKHIDIEMHNADEVDDQSMIDPTARRALTREIDEGELTLFTEHFRTVLSASPERTTHSPSKQVNGSANGNDNTNGHHVRSHPNGEILRASLADAIPFNSPAGKQKSSKTRKPTNNALSSSSTPQPNATEPIIQIPSPPPTVGQKRKKPGA